MEDRRARLRWPWLLVMSAVVAGPAPQVGASNGTSSSACARGCTLPCRELPRCAIGVFVHVEKTGGTTTRFFLKDQPGYENGMLNDGGFPRAGIPRAPTADAPRPLLPNEERPVLDARPGHPRQAGELGSVAWANLVVNVETTASVFDAHPRMIFEVHGSQYSQALPRIVEGIARMRAAPEFKWRGCDAFVFMSVREPMQFLLSNLHDSFRHSFYRGHFIDHTKPETEYYQAGWHDTKLSRVAAEISDSQTKTLAKYVTNQYRARAELPPPESAVKQALDALDRVDIVGITHRGDHLFAQLIARLGLQKVAFSIVGSNSVRVHAAHCANPGWRAAEQRLFAAAANASALDQRLYAHAVRLAAAQAGKLPGGSAHLDCQAASLARTNAPRRPQMATTCEPARRRRIGPKYRASQQRLKEPGNLLPVDRPAGPRRRQLQPRGDAAGSEVASWEDAD